MIRSILIKLSLLMATIGTLFVLGWPWEETADHQPGRGQEIGGEADTLSVSIRADGAAISPEGFLRAEVPLEHSVNDPGRGSIESRVDINHSTAPELEALPGIGPILAQRIIETRKMVGAFHSPEELGEVRGLGSKRIERLRPLLKFSHGVKE